MLLPFPLSWCTWFLLYGGSVGFRSPTPNTFPDEVFWWDEALYISFGIGSLFAIPIVVILLSGCIIFELIVWLKKS